MNWAIIAPILGVIFAPLISYFVALRTKSGRIKTTEAEDLWTEATKLRDTYRDEIHLLRKEMTQMRDELIAARAEAAMANTLKDELEHCRGEIKELSRGMTEAWARAHSAEQNAEMLEKEFEKLKAEHYALKERVEGEGGGA